MTRRACKLTTLCLFAGLAVSAAHARVTFESLLKEMTDLEALSYFPDPAYTTKQFSSYDQHSTDPRVLTDENWFANGDRGQYLRTETRNGEKEYVLMDTDGPGAIVRFWSANPVDAGVVRVYFDGEEAPAIEMPLTDMLGGGGMPFIKPISIEVSKGWNSYLPIPYAKHCKVTTSKPDFYYQINYRTYEKGTKVETYTSQLSAAASELVQSIADRLAKPAEDTSPQSRTRLDKSFDLTAGQSSAAELQSGAAAVRRMVVKVDADDIEQALRQMVIEITFDNHGEPAVRAPLGDFFGTAPGINPHQSLCSGVLDDGSLYSQWTMPFKKSCKFRMRNLGSARVKATLHAVTSRYKWTPNSMYFHAGFRSEYPIKTRPRQDWNFLNATGKGRFVGTMLHVTNPVKDWWGEGDEKIYVDGEAFPSHFGTGSEDYFGYAWC